MARTGQAFTLIELLLAILITAVIALAVAGVAGALSAAYSHTGDCYDNIDIARSTVMRLQALLRKARLVTATTPEALIVWTGDANGDGVINRDEVAAVYLDSAAREVRYCAVVFPPTMDPTLKASLNIERNLSALMSPTSALALITGDAYAQTHTLASSVAGFNVCAAPAAPLARLVQVELSVSQGSRPLKLRSAACVRVDPTDVVEESAGQYVLITGPLLVVPD